jgi:hypothetical protein
MFFLAAIAYLIFSVAFIAACVAFPVFGTIVFVIVAIIAINNFERALLSRR